MIRLTASDSIQFIAVAMRLGVTVGDLARSTASSASSGNLSHPKWGAGHARGVGTPDGGVRNVLTFPPSLP